jgi:hypothetical protein
MGELNFPLTDVRSPVFQELSTNIRKNSIPVSGSGKIQNKFSAKPV